MIAYTLKAEIKKDLAWRYFEIRIFKQSFNAIVKIDSVLEHGISAKPKTRGCTFINYDKPEILTLSLKEATEFIKFYKLGSKYPNYVTEIKAFIELNYKGE